MGCIAIGSPSVIVQVDGHIHAVVDGDALTYIHLQRHRAAVLRRLDGSGQRSVLPVVVLRRQICTAGALFAVFIGLIKVVVFRRCRVAALAALRAVGQPIGSFFGYVTDGIFNTTEEVRNSAQYQTGRADFEQTYKPGDFRWKDLNGDNQITAEDRTYLGSPLPDFMFGIPLSVGYKNFDLSIFFQGQTGNKIFNVMDYYLYNGASGNCYADIRSKHWSGQIEGSGREFFPKNLNASVPDLDNGDAPRNFRSSDFFVQDGSYLRLKQLMFTYNFPQSILSKLKISSLAISLTGYNLLTFTGYDGFDPEVGRVSGTEGNNLSMGVDQGNYPQARSFTLGVKLGL